MELTTYQIHKIKKIVTDFLSGQTTVSRKQIDILSTIPILFFNLLFILTLSRELKNWEWFNIIPFFVWLSFLFYIDFTFITEIRDDIKNGKY